MNVITKLDFSKIPVNTPFNLRAMVALEGAKEHTEGERVPLNLALVLDRSGSMGGSKLSNVKKAAELLVSHLDDNDILSLTIFDDRIHVLIEPTQVGAARPGILAGIQSVRAGGSTFLSGAYTQGLQLALSQNRDGRTTRVLLLTDGLANVGETNLDRLCGLSSSALERGITTSTIGVGADFNEELLGKMAEHGGGSTYFIDRPEEAEEVFAEELRDLFSRVAEACEVQFAGGSPVLGTIVLNTYRRLQNGNYLVGDLFSGRRKSLVVEVNVMPQKHTGVFELGQFQVSYCSEGPEGPVENQLNLPVQVQVVSQEEFRNQTPDPEVTLEAALLAAARVRLEAIRLADEHRFEEASLALEDCANGLERLQIRNPVLAREIMELRQLAENLRMRGLEFYSPTERKRAYYSSDLYSKGRADKVAAMLRRQRSFTNSFDPDES